jgi:hypothetical protein
LRGRNHAGLQLTAATALNFRLDRRAPDSPKCARLVR